MIDFNFKFRKKKIFVVKQDGWIEICYLHMYARTWYSEDIRVIYKTPEKHV